MKHREMQQEERKDLDYENAIKDLGRFTAILRKVQPEARSQVYDIGLSVGKPILLGFGSGVRFLRENGSAAEIISGDCPLVTQKDMDEIFMRLCGYSVYSHTAELQKGYITAAHGLRVGVGGTAVTENGMIRAVRDIRSLTIRIPREVRGCANPLLRSGIRIQNGILLAGAPSSGKTTLLRDIARYLGNSGARVVVLDERSELLSDGFELGICTEVLTGYPKREGLSHAIRCLSPEYILCDELGDDDLTAVRTAVFSGVSLIATVHAGDAAHFCQRPLCRGLLETGAFESIVFLRGRKHPAETENIYRAGDLLAHVSASSDSAGLSAGGYSRSTPPQIA